MIVPSGLCLVHLFCGNSYQFPTNEYTRNDTPRFFCSHPNNSPVVTEHYSLMTLTPRVKGKHLLFSLVWREALGALKWTALVFYSVRSGSSVVCNIPP